MSNRLVSKDVSDNIIASSVMALSAIKNMTTKLVSYKDANNVTVGFTGCLIPVKMGDYWGLIDTATDVHRTTDLDTGSIAATTAYYVYSVTNGSAISFKTSVSDSAPTGYSTSTSEKLGGFTTDGSSNIDSATVWDVKTNLGLGATTDKILVGGGANMPPVATTATGTGAPVRANGGTLIAPNLGTPASGTLTNCTGLPLTGLATQPVLTNLLDNTEWKAMSGSTLENVGSDLVTNGADWTGASGATPPTGWSSDGGSVGVYTISGSGQAGNCIKIEHDGTHNNPHIYQTYTNLTVGKLYKIIGYFKNGDATNGLIRVGYGSGAGLDDIYSSGSLTDSDWSTAHSQIFEATGTKIVITLNVITSTTGQYGFFDSITLHEVTPGYVADTVAPDGWIKDTAVDIWREHNGANTKVGAFYALKATNASGTLVEVQTPVLNSELSWVAKLAGRTVTFGIWAKTSTASVVRLRIRDSVGSLYSSYHTGSGDFEWLEISKLIDAGASYANININIDNNATAYFSQPMLVFGSSIGEGNYAPMPSEQILTQANITLTDYTATTSAADGIINLEAQSSGMIGKGVKAVLVKAYGKDSAAGDGVGFDVQSTSTVEDGISIDTQVNNIKVQGQGWVKTDSNGDIYFDHRGSGASALTADIKVIGIMP